MDGKWMVLWRTALINQNQNDLTLELNQSTATTIVSENLCPIGAPV